MLAWAIRVACGSGPSAGPAQDETAQLDTALRQRPDGIWHTHGATVEALDIAYRFVTAQRRDLVTKVTGSYRLTWWNRTTSRLQIDYDLQFLDAEGLEVARLDPAPGPELALGAARRREMAAGFEITVASIERANQIASLHLLASFSE